MLCDQGPSNLAGTARMQRFWQGFQKGYAPLKSRSGTLACVDRTGADELPQTRQAVLMLATVALNKTSVLHERVALVVTVVTTPVTAAEGQLQHSSTPEGSNS